MMNNKIKHVFIALAATLVVGCGAVRQAEEAVADVEQQSTDTTVYANGATTARQVILDSIGEGWPDKETSPLPGERIGYEFVLHFAIDREHIIAEAFPQADGHFFRVTNRGTAPAVGIPARNKLVPLLEKYAKAAPAD
jgi:hypothetical protein